MAAVGREIAVRLRAAPSTGRHGARGVEVETEIPRCHFLPRTSSERPDDRQSTVVIGLTLVAPGGTDLVASDRVRRPLDGTVWAVEGQPGDYRKGGRSKAVVAALRRVTG